MPVKKTYYEILGVPRNATPELIKRRYRQLARKYHPDVSEDKAAAKAAFLQISEAYQTLNNPDKRTIYNSTLDAEMFRIEPNRTTTTHRTTSTAGQGSRQGTASNPIAEAQRMVLEAQAAFTRGQYRTAEFLCRQARKLDKRNLQAHVLLGDIYRVQEQVDPAIAMYTIAAQLDPTNKEIMAKLNKLVHQQGRVSDATVAHAERSAALKVGFNLMGCSLGVFMFVMLAMSAENPIQWLRMNLPMVGTWSTSLVVTLLITGALAGFLLSVNEAIEPLDQELVFQGVTRMGAKRANYPVGLVLMLFNLFSFYAAVVMYTVIGLVQDSLSKSVYKSFVAAFALVLLASLLYSPGSGQVLAFGGNVAFAGVLFGWGVGDMFRPGW